LREGESKKIRMGRKGDFVCKKGVREKRKTEKGNRYRKKGEI
jgi:hypothetical protein